jgi:hypothetical protein
MEGLTRLVAESLARHGFDRPVDYRRLSWSRWFRCESHHSLLCVPSKPGVFALAEEIGDFGGPAFAGTEKIDVAAAAAQPFSNPRFPETGSPAPEAVPARMLGVLQFCEDGDMAFVLDRMLSRQNPMYARLASGRCFVRFVVVEDETQRRSICAALNQWLLNSGEKATGIGAHFATSLELSVARAPATADSTTMSPNPPTAPQPDPGAAINLHNPSPFPSGF